jgi:hypothetical protein
MNRRSSVSRKEDLYLGWPNRKANSIVHRWRDFLKKDTVLRSNPEILDPGAMEGSCLKSHAPPARGVWWVTRIYKLSEVDKDRGDEVHLLWEIHCDNGRRRWAVPWIDDMALDPLIALGKWYKPLVCQCGKLIQFITLIASMPVVTCMEKWKGT